MSTRAFVGFGTPQKWQGVYQHADGHPSWVGPLLWEAFKHFGTDATGLGLFRRELLSAGRFEIFTRDTLGRPYDGPTETLLAQSADPLHIPFVYLIASDTGRLRILATILTQPSLEHGLMHQEIANWDLAADEPDWDRIGMDHPARLRSDALHTELTRARWGASAAGSGLGQQFVRQSDLIPARLRALREVMEPESLNDVVAEASAWLTRNKREDVAKELQHAADSTT